MRKLVQVSLALLLIGVAGVVAFQLLCPREREPAYQGKALRVWLQEWFFVVGRDEQVMQTRERAEDAVRHIGTNAIPTLLEMLRKQDSPTLIKMSDLWMRYVHTNRRVRAWAGPWLMPAWFKNQALYVGAEGALGFKMLGPDAWPAVPALTELCEHYNSTNPLRNPDHQMGVLHALIWIGPAATPSFLRWAASSNLADRKCGVIGLGTVRPESSVAVPLLSTSLSDTNPDIRWMAAASLGNYGSEARQAVPALVQLLHDPSGVVRCSTTEALKKIDPEAATKAGVQ